MDGSHVPGGLISAGAAPGLAGPGFQSRKGGVCLVLPM